MNEAVVATIGSNALVLDTPEEHDLSTEAGSLERRISDMVVETDLGYTAAGETLKQIKTLSQRITMFWEPLRVAAKASYDNVLARKKEMLAGPEKAEKELKRKMGDYVLRKEREARELEERKRREAQEEINRKLDEAAELESKGDLDGADFALAEAEVYDQYAAGVTGEVQKTKHKGVSTAKTWKIKSIDPRKVPVMFNGVELRPVDKAAVLRLVKASKGQITIPGVEIEEDVSVSVRV